MQKAIGAIRMSWKQWLGRRSITRFSEHRPAAGIADCIAFAGVLAIAPVCRSERNCHKIPLTLIDWSMSAPAYNTPIGLLSIAFLACLILEGGVAKGALGSPSERSWSRRTERTCGVSACPSRVTVGTK